MVLGLPTWPSGKESACSAGAGGSIPGSGRSPGGGHGSPFPYSCLGNPMVRGALWSTVHGVEKSQTQFSDWTHTHGNSLRGLCFQDLALISLLFIEWWTEGFKIVRLTILNLNGPKNLKSHKEKKHFWPWASPVPKSSLNRWTGIICPASVGEGEPLTDSSIFIPWGRGEAGPKEGR